MRAILLAAGMGTRLRPLTLTTPKSLIEVGGKPLMERQIEYLREVGVEEIIVLTGYLNEKFDYLKEKYGVKIVHNDKYDKYNNIYTMYLVREYLKDTYVIDADVYLRRNFLKKEMSGSAYFTGIKDFENEWILKFDDNDKVYDIEVGDGRDFIMSGVSYWSEKDGEIIRGKLESAIDGGDFTNLYWDNIVKDNLAILDVHIERIKGDDWFEIDSLEDLEKAITTLD